MCHLRAMQLLKSQFSVHPAECCLQMKQAVLSLCTIELWHWLNQPYGVLERTCWEKSVNPPVVIRPSVWIYPFWAGDFTPTHNFQVFHVGNMHALVIRDTVCLRHIFYKTIWTYCYCRCFHTILTLSSIFQCLLRKKAHYKTLCTLPSLPPRLSSSDIPKAISFTYIQTVCSLSYQPLLSSLLSFLPALYSEHPS